MEDNHRTFLEIDQIEKVIMRLLPLLRYAKLIGIERDNIHSEGFKLAIFLKFDLGQADIGVEVISGRQDPSSSCVYQSIPRKQSMHCCLKTSVVLALMYLFSEMIAPPRKVFIV